MEYAYYAAALLAVIVIWVAWRVHVSECGFQAWFLHSIARGYTRVVFRRRAANSRTIPEKSAAIIIANHTSPVDPMLMWADHCREFQGPTIRLPGFMTAKEYCEMRGLVGWICSVMESIPVARSGRDMGPARDALRRLNDNELVGVFPEGKINDVTPDLQLIQGDTGAAWLALKSRVPVIPVYIRNAPRGKSMVCSFLVRSQTTLHYGRPIDISRWYDQRLTQDVLREVTDELMLHLADLGGVKPPQAGGTDPSGTPCQQAIDQTVDAERSR
jgi:1-acyl-sn-glycerol-3-phosphate acyltransferase